MIHRYDEIHELLTFLMLDILRSPQHLVKVLLFLPQILLQALLLLLDALQLALVLLLLSIDVIHTVEQLFAILKVHFGQINAM